MRFSFGYELTEVGPRRDPRRRLPTRGVAVMLHQDRPARENGEIVEITDRVDLSRGLRVPRLIVRRERPHPGATVVHRPRRSPLPSDPDRPDRH